MSATGVAEPGSLERVVRVAELRAELREKLAALDYPEAALCRAHERQRGGVFSCLEDLSPQALESWLATVDWALRMRAMEAPER